MNYYRYPQGLYDVADASDYQMTIAVMDDHGSLTGIDARTYNASAQDGGQGYWTLGEADYFFTYVDPYQVVPDWQRAVGSVLC